MFINEFNKMKQELEKIREERDELKCKVDELSHLLNKNKFRIDLLTKSENEVLIMLMNSTRKNKLTTELFKQFYKSKLKNKEDMVSCETALHVFIHRIRKKLKNLGVTINNLHTHGYWMENESKDVIKKMINGKEVS